MRCAIYTRFSTDKQDHSSIEDQYRVCTDFASREGWKVVSKFCDEGISGAATGNRPGFKAMISAASRRDFDVLLVIELSRLSRSAGDLNKTIDRLTFCDVRIIGVSSGYDSARKGHKMQAGLEGIMGEQFREMVREKTYTALQGRAQRGARAGGITYGYRSVSVDGVQRLKVDPEHAEVVREIFRLFVNGMSPRAIAYELNQRRVPSPRASTWAVSAVYGDKKRPGVGILNNPLYLGRVIWNRSNWIKDPDSGKRKRRERPESEWIVREDESLRIISSELWDAAQHRLSTPTTQGGTKGMARPRTLFSGLLRCGGCGGPVIAVSSDFFGCSNRKDRGPTVCAGLNTRRAQTEQALLGVIRGDLLSPLSLAQLHSDTREFLRAATTAAEQAQSETRRRLMQLEVEITNIVAAIKAGAFSTILQSELSRLESERAHLLQARTASPRPPEEIHDLIQRFKRKVLDLQNTIAHHPAQARAAVAEMLGEIVLKKEGDAVFAEFEDPAERLFITASGGISASGSGGRI